jgi:hypothetical protein
MDAGYRRSIPLILIYLKEAVLSMPLPSTTICHMLSPLEAVHNLFPHNP